MTTSPEKYQINGEVVRRILTDSFAFRRGIHLLGSRDSGKVFFVDIAVLGVDGKERRCLEEFLSELRDSEIPDTVSVSYKDPWKTHPSGNSKSVNLIETADTHWKYRIYLVDVGSKVHNVLKKEDDEVYYKLLRVKIERLSSIVDKFYPKDSDLLSLEKKLKKRYVRK